VALPRPRKSSLILLQHPQFLLFADRDVQRQDGASDPADDAEKKDENEGDEDIKRHRAGPVCMNSRWAAAKRSLQPGLAAQ
jgi:hypothetical protein